MMVARPKKLKKPTISVTVVKITVLPMAGSISIFFKNRGMVAPKKPAITRLISIERAITTPNNIPCSNQTEAIVPIIIAKRVPFNNEIPNSFLIILAASF